MDDLLPVRLVGGVSESSVEKGFARAVAVSLHGVMRLEGDHLVIEWSGTRHVSEAGRGTARSAVEQLPVSRATIPVASLGRVTLRRHWWRRRLEIASADLSALQAIPTARAGRVVLEITRADRHLAADLVSQIELAAADHALAAAEQLRALPPRDSR